MSRPRDEGSGRSIGEALAGWMGQRGLAQQRLAQRGVDGAGSLCSLLDCWEEAAGGELAAHSRPLRLDGGTLVVAVDHPGVGVGLGMQSNELLERLARCSGTAVAERIEVIVRGTRGLE